MRPLWTIVLVLSSTLLEAQSPGSLTKLIPWPGEAQKLFVKATNWFNDTTLFSRGVVLGKALPETFTVIGAGATVLNYSAGGGADVLKGTALLAYKVKVVASNEGFELTVFDPTIDGTPFENDTCWIHCNNSPYPADREARAARMRIDSKWRQLAGSARTHVNNIPGLFGMFIMRPPH